MRDRRTHEHKFGRKEISNVDVINGLIGRNVDLQIIETAIARTCGGLVLGADIDLLQVNQRWRHAVGSNHAAQRSVRTGIVQCIAAVTKAAYHVDPKRPVEVGHVRHIERDHDVGGRLVGRERTERKLQDDQLVARRAVDHDWVAARIGRVRVGRVAAGVECNLGCDQGHAQIGRIDEIHAVVDRCTCAIGARNRKEQVHIGTEADVAGCVGRAVVKTDRSFERVAKLDRIGHVDRDRRFSRHQQTVFKTREWHRRTQHDVLPTRPTRPPLFPTGRPYPTYISAM